MVAARFLPGACRTLLVGESGRYGVFLAVTLAAGR